MNKKDTAKFIEKLKADYEERLIAQRERIVSLTDDTERLKTENSVYKRKVSDISGALLAANQKSRELESAAEARFNLEIERLRLFRYKWDAFFARAESKYALSDEVKNLRSLVSSIWEILDRNELSSRKIAEIAPKLDKLNTGDLPPLQKDEPQIVEKIIEKPVYIEKIVEKPVYIEKIIEKPVEVVKKTEEPQLDKKPEAVEDRKEQTTDRKSEPSFEEEMSKVSGDYAAEISESENGFNLDEVLNPKKDLDLEALCRELGLLPDDTDK